MPNIDSNWTPLYVSVLYIVNLMQAYSNSKIGVDLLLLVSAGVPGGGSMSYLFVVQENWIRIITFLQQKNMSHAIIKLLLSK